MPAPVSPVDADQSVAPRVSILSIMLFLVAALIARSLIDVGMTDAGFSPGVARNLSALAGYAVLGLFMWPILSKVWPLVQSQLQRPGSWWTPILTSVGLGFVLWLGQMLILMAVTPLQWEGQLPHAVLAAPTYSISCSNPGSLLLAIPVMTVATPIVEEIIHRGIIFRTLLPYGNRTAILLSAMLFAILHEPATIPYAFLFGIFLALQMLHGRNLWATIITHAVTNLLVIISATCLVGQWRPGVITWTAASPATLIGMSLIGCATAAWILATRIKVGAEPAGSAPD